LVSPAVKYSAAHKKSPTHKRVNKINFCVLRKLLLKSTVLFQE